MLDNINIATPLSGNSNFQAFVQVVQEELARIDPKKLLLYQFDIVDESLLDLLAEQFDMLGTNGWMLADTVEQKRELLKSAYVLHVIKGTSGGIREVVRRLGFPDIIIEENAAAPEGAENPWAYFKVKYVLPDERPIDALQINAMAGLINRYKNARSVLSDLSFQLAPTDILPMLGKVKLTVRNASTNAIISQDTNYNWMQPGFARLMFNKIRYLLSYDIAFEPDYMFQKIGFGTSGTVQQPGQESTSFTLTSPYIKELSDNPNAVSAFDQKSATNAGGSVFTRMGMVHYFSLDASEANGKTIRELGLILVDQREANSGGNPNYDVHPDYIACRIARAPIVKTANIKIEGEWEIALYPNFNPET